MSDEHLWRKGDFVISTEKSFLDRYLVFRYLNRESYWAKGIPKDVVVKSIKETPLVFGIYEGNPAEEDARQVGFARVITDFATFAYLSDVFVLPAHQGLGLGKWLLEVIMNHPELQGIRRFALATKDAHSLYEKFGFTPLKDPSAHMEINKGISIYPQEG